MSVTASRELRDQPQDIALLPTGELVIWSWSRSGILLHSYDGELAVVWSQNVGPHACGFRVDSHGALWVVYRMGASAFNGRGEMIGRAEAPALPGMEVAALAFFEDEFVFAYQHEESRAPDLPALVRLTRDGVIRWSSRLTTDAVALDQPFDARLAVVPDSRFAPRTWVCACCWPSTPRCLKNAGVSMSRLARLMPDGTIVRGDLLEGYYTSRPHVQVDGTTYFARHGLMNVACDLLIERRILISRGLPRDEVFHSLAGGPQRLFTAYSANRVPRSGPISHVSGLLRIATGD